MRSRRSHFILFYRTMSSEARNKNSSEAGKLPLDALYYDYYRDEDSSSESEPPSSEGPCRTREQKLEQLKQLDNQHCSQRLEDVYPNFETTTPEKLKELIKQCEQFQNQGEYKEYCESEDRLKETKKQQEENKDEPDQ